MSEKKSGKASGISFEALSSLDAPVSFWRGIPFGLQHVMAMFVANLAPIFIVASAANMTPEQSATVIQAGLLTAGLGTCLQLYGAWMIGSRLPMVTGISFTYVAAAVAICADKGYGAVVGAVLVGGLLELVLGLTARYWRRFVPPIVSAIVVTSIGFSLLTVGAESFGGGSGAEDFGSWQNLTLGLISLVACLAFQLLMKGTAKQLSVLFGLVVGYVAAMAMGKVDLSGFAHLQIVSVPRIMPFKPEFDPGAIISLGLLYVVSSVEVLGDTAALTKVGLNRLPTERETAGAIAGDGPDLLGLRPVRMPAADQLRPEHRPGGHDQGGQPQGDSLRWSDPDPGQLRAGHRRGVQFDAAGGARRLHDHDVRATSSSPDSR